MIKRIAILLFLLGAMLHLKGDHIVGSEIVYNYLGGDEYKILTTVYRNCNDSKFNGNGGGTNSTNSPDLTSLDIYGYNSSQKKYILLGTSSTTRISITDVTKLCPGETSTCQPVNSYANGVEEHLFESDIDLTSHIDNGYIEFKLGFSLDSRSDGISAPVVQNHFNFCYINTISQLSSPKSDGFLKNRVVTNNPVFIDASYSYQSFDSISYALDTAYISESLTNSYPAGKSHLSPLSVLPGNDPYSYKPRGIFLDSFSGQLIFTPTMNADIGVFVIECRAFKKISGNMTLVSKVRKDFEIRVENSSNNNPYFFGLANGTFKACAGETYSDDLFYADESTGMNNDTVYLSLAAKNTLPISLDHVVGNFAPFRSSTFTWNVPDDAARDLPYVFYTIATDSNCPKLGLSYYNYTVKVEKAKQITASKQQTNCNSFLCIADNNSNTDFLRFSILDSNKNEVSSSVVLNDSAELIFPTKGKWYIQLLSLEEGAYCSYKYLDSVQIADFKQPTIDFGPDITTCYLEDINIMPALDITNAPFDLDWYFDGVLYPNEILDIDTQFTQSKLVVANIIDGTGCKTSDTLEIKVNPKWNNQFKDTGLCLNYPVPLYLPSALVDTAGLLSYSFSGLNVTGSNFSANGLAIGFYKVYIEVVDTFNCTYFDSFNVEIGQPFAITISPLADYCQKSGLININGISQPKPSTGTWSYSTNPTYIVNQNFNTDVADSGTFSLQYSVTQNGCTVDTLSEIKILYAPEITLAQSIPDSICQLSSPFEIRTIESPKIVNINSVRDSIFKPSQYDDKADILILRTHAMNRCINRYQKQVIIDSAVQANLVLDKPLFCFEDLDLDLKLSRTEYNSTWNTSGNGIFNAVDANHYTYQLNNAEKNSNSNISFQIELTSINTCPDKVIDTTIVQNRELQMGYDSFILNPCELGNLSVKLNDQNFPYYDSVNWMVNGVPQNGNGFANDQHTFFALPKGNQTIRVIPFVNGCSKSFDTIVTVYPKPNPILLASPKKFYSARFPNISFDIQNFNIDYTYNWSTNPAYQGLTGNNPFEFKMPSDTGIHNFTLYTTSDKGCKDTLNYEAYCLPKDWILVPNAFSPNNDGPIENEVFKAQGRVTSDFVLQVFNMWGEKLFESQDINEGWNGMYQNKPCTPGNYIYIVKFTDDIGRPIKLKGNLILLR
jgi:gliding motility-associated-like protein